MSAIDEALIRPSGARFWRAALQVNPFSYAANYRGLRPAVEEDEYNAAMAAACLRNSIEVVGVADHNSVENLDQLRAALGAAHVRVFPGFEIATAEKVHAVCLFPEGTAVAELNKYLGALDAVGELGRPSQHGFEEVARLVHERDGVCFAAHVDGKSGVLRLSADGGGLAHIWRNEKCLLAVQLARPFVELPVGLQNILRNQDPNYKRQRLPAVINAKDVAKPDDLDDPTASVFVKMTEPTVHSLRQAFLDPESRVRLMSAQKRSEHPFIEAIAWEGGFLDGVQLHLSENLNAVVGGRGTGKSTVVETIRFAFDLPPRGEKAKKSHETLVRENLGRGGLLSVRLRSSAQMGRTFTIVRQLGSPPEVRDERGARSNFKPVDLIPGLDILGQDEILELATQATPRRRLVERFLPESQLEDASRVEAVKELEKQRAKLKQAKDELDELEGDAGRLAKSEELVARFDELGLAASLEAVTRLSREKAVVKEAHELLPSVEESVEAFTEAANLELGFMDDESLEGLDNASTLAAMREVLTKLDSALDKSAAMAEVAISAAKTELASLKSGWDSEVKKIEQGVAKTIAALPEIAGKNPSVVAKEFARVTDDIARLRPRQKSLEAKRTALKRLRKERDDLISKCRLAEHERFVALRKAAEELNKGELAGKLRIVVTHAGDRDPLKALLQGIDGLGTKKIEWVDHAEALTIAGLIDGMRQGQSKLLALYKDAGLQPSAAQILASLAEERVMEIEEINLEPTVTLELNVGSGDRPSFKRLDSLSTGQKCTAILHLLLVKNTSPLLVDQPEDHLDNAFIADRIVQELRDAKHRRQFLFATHNANIPVFGDAEWIGVLEATSDHARLDDDSVGSVDRPSVQAKVAQVLEGGRDAFAMRRIKYGF